jgi:hypothetical protein
MKDYLIKIYRRKKSGPRKLVRGVGEVGVAGSRHFSNLDELWSILNSPKAETGKSSKPKKPNEPDKLSKPQR